MLQLWKYSTVLGFVKTFEAPTQYSWIQDIYHKIGRIFSVVLRRWIMSSQEGWLCQSEDNWMKRSFIGKPDIIIFQRSTFPIGIHRRWIVNLCFELSLLQKTRPLSTCLLLCTFVFQICWYQVFLKGAGTDYLMNVSKKHQIVSKMYPKYIKIYP